MFDGTSPKIYAQEGIPFQMELDIFLIIISAFTLQNQPVLITNHTLSIWWEAVVDTIIFCITWKLHQFVGIHISTNSSFESNKLKIAYSLTFLAWMRFE